MDSPYILEETENYAVVFKPPKMHSEGLPKINKDTTLNDWFISQSGYNKMIRIMHRLDYETQGLVLFAKNESSYLFFKSAQDNGEFIKEYSARVIKNDLNRDIPFIIESYFRPYGHGRKLVRPVIEDGKKHKEIAKDKGGFYRTEVINSENNILTMRIKRGFRHQIRCHLWWIGYPIINDPLYSANEEQPAPDSILALRSHALYFPDPIGGNMLEYRINKIDYPACE
ncbi:MAG: RNA pseudouridine synthase [Treponema sp.]|nr:RNA pseudouridine synthase [Treponema sp.]